MTDHKPTFYHELSSTLLTTTVACKDEQHASKSTTLAFGAVMAGDVAGNVPAFKSSIAKGCLHQTLKRRSDETCSPPATVVLHINTF